MRGVASPSSGCHYRRATYRCCKSSPDISTTKRGNHASCLYQEVAAQVCHPARRLLQQCRPRVGSGPQGIRSDAARAVHRQSPPPASRGAHLHPRIRLSAGRARRRTWRGASSCCRRPATCCSSWHGARAPVRQAGQRRGAVGRPRRQPRDAGRRLPGAHAGGRAGRRHQGQGCPTRRSSSCSPPAPMSVVEQAWDIAVGQVQAPAMPAFKAMPTPSTPSGAQAGQSRRRRRGQVTRWPRRRRPRCRTRSISATCTARPTTATAAARWPRCIGAQNPQSAALGPTDAYTYAMNKGLDILMASEHNHMYDGSDGTNAVGRSGRRQGAVPVRPGRRRRTSTPPIRTSSACTAWSGASSTTAAT